jgi:hypothetical protein
MQRQHRVSAVARRAMATCGVNNLGNLLRRGLVETCQAATGQQPPANKGADAGCPAANRHGATRLLSECGKAEHPGHHEIVAE